MEVFVNKVLLSNAGLENVLRKMRLPVTQPPLILERDTASNLLHAMAGKYDVVRKLKQKLSWPKQTSMAEKNPWSVLMTEKDSASGVDGGRKKSTRVLRCYW